MTNLDNPEDGSDYHERFLDREDASGDVVINALLDWNLYE